MTSHLSLDLSLDKDSSMVDQFNKSCSEKFIKFMNLALKSQGTKMFTEVCKIIEDKQTNYKVEVNILEFFDYLNIETSEYFLIRIWI